MQNNHTLRRHWPILALVMSMLLGMSVTAPAQEATGKIIGTATDQQGDVIVGVKVTVTNVATKVSREAITDNEGNYQVIALPRGVYRVTFEREGFKKVVSDEKTLQLNQAMRVDPVLEVGAAAQSVEVTVQSTAVETVNPTLGQSVTSRPIINLPLNGRNVLDLARLQPGVSENNPGDTGAGTFNIAGGRADSVTFLLDGGNNNNLLSNGVVFNPNPDAVAEFRLLTSNYTAEYGRNGGGVISVVTKSGTNSLHGSVYDYLRNDALNANTFFNNRDGVPREVLKRNQFGFTVGGPAVIPKVINGRDRFFFFVAYQGQRLSAANTSTTPTFTPDELRGDFSKSADGGPHPGVADFLSAFPFFQPDPALAAQGIIAPSRINSVARNYISNNLIPTSPTGQIVSQSGAKNDNDELTLKFDVTVRKEDRLAVTLGTARNPQLIPFTTINAANFPNVSGYPVTTNANRYFLNLAYTSVFSPRLLNEFRFSTNRQRQVQLVPASKQPTAADLGVGVTPDNPTGPPRLSFASGLDIGFPTNGPTTLINNTFAFTDTLTWIKGNNNFKLGGYFSPYQNNTVFDFFVNGNFFFSGSSGGIGTGNDFADFLLGLPDEYLQFGEAPSNIRSKSTYVFGQDEWRVRHNLTLTLGLRYEYDTPKLDTQGRSFSLNLGKRSTVFPNAPIGLLFPGDPGAPDGANFSDKNNFAPRFGFAWSPWKDGKTSVRGGFGVFYDILKGEDNLQFNGQAPFFGFSDLFFLPLSDNPAQQTNYYSAPYVATNQPNSFPSRPPASNIDFAAAGFTPFGGGGVFFVDPHLRTPYTYQYSLSVQRELPGSMLAEVSYVGNSGHKFTSLVDENAFILGTENRRYWLTPGNDSSSISYLNTFSNVGNSSYNSLQTSLQKRVSQTKFGATYFTLSYTYAHAIDTVSGFRNRNSKVPAYNTKLFRASADYDIRQRLAFSGGWDLPFDRLWSSGPKRLTSGWSIYPIVTRRTGFPLGIFAGLPASRVEAGPSGAGDRDLVRAKLVGPITFFDPKLNQKLGKGSGNFYFNPTSFLGCILELDPDDPNFCPNGFPTSDQVIANPSLGSYGMIPRNAFRGPGRTNFDLAVAKSTNILGERLKAEFRADFFNIFNTAQFNNPITTITSGQFGQITATADPRIIQFALRLAF